MLSTRFNIDVHGDFETILLGKGVQLKKMNTANKINHLEEPKPLLVGDLLQLPMSVYFMNTQSETQYLNQYCSDSVELSIQKCIGKTIGDISPSPLSEQIIRNDQFILQSNQKQFFTEILDKSSSEIFEFLSFKMPWYDSDMRLIGIFGCAINMQQDSVSSFLNQLHEFGLLQRNQKIHSTLSLQFNHIEMTYRETTVIKELIKGKSARIIADNLNLSKRTVETHIENIKIKLGVFSKSELIEFLIQNLQKILV